jgi:hypothetical protein
MPTPTIIPTATAVDTPTPTPTMTPAPEPTETSTPTLTPVPTATFTPTPVLANLAPFRPDSWDAPLVVSNVRSNFVDFPPAHAAILEPGAKVFVHWAVKNESTVAIDGPFQVGVMIDGQVEETYAIESLEPSKVVKFINSELDIVLASGPHEFALIVDLIPDITESNEVDNEFAVTSTIRFVTPTPVPSSTPEPTNLLLGQANDALIGVPYSGAHDGLHYSVSISPSNPRVGDVVTLSATVTGSGGIPQYTLNMGTGQNTVLRLDSQNPISVSGPLGTDISWTLTAVGFRVFQFTIHVNYERSFSCPGSGGSGTSTCFGFTNSTSEELTILVNP